MSPVVESGVKLGDWRVQFHHEYESRVELEKDVRVLQAGNEEAVDFDSVILEQADEGV